MPGFPPGGAFNVVVPGILVMTALFGSAFVGFGLCDEMREGVVEGIVVTPMSRMAMLRGPCRSLRDVSLLMAQALILVALAIPFGLRDAGFDRPDGVAGFVHSRARTWSASSVATSPGERSPCSLRIHDARWPPAQGRTHETV